MSQPLVFYDILVDPTGQDRHCWSANTRRTRLALNYKKIPYTTVWVQYADIQPVLKGLGATPTDKRPTGEDRYTMPTIRNPATGEVISDSAKIIAYLEEKYPERPLVPRGTLAQELAFTNEIMGVVGIDLIPYFVGPASAAMGARSLAAFERFMRALDGGPPFAARARPMAGDWRRVREGFARLAQQYAAGRPYRFGARLTYADLVVAAILATVRNCVSEEQFEDVRAWDGGRWGALVDEVEGAGYLETDRGEVYDAHT